MYKLKKEREEYILVELLSQHLLWQRDTFGDCTHSKGGVGKKVPTVVVF